ncbi:MAG: response regulator transcription factor [Chlorobi bacterium]|nr:response regulator transcription factor [Chlorobiota bacterium]
MNPEAYRILLVDDEKDILEFLSYNLKQEGYQVCTANNGRDAIEKAAEENPQLILLDVMMPGMDGIETCAEIRKLPEMSQTIIAFLTARGEDYSQIAGFEAGGDDYIIKPIKPRVLLSRIAALLKRAGKNSESGKQEEKTQEIVLDRERYLVVNRGVELSLPRKEFELLALLISRRGKVFSRDEIFRRVWGDQIIVGDRTLDVHIRKLREKLGPEVIITVKGVGYKFAE